MLGVELWIFMGLINSQKNAMLMYPLKPVWLIRSLQTPESLIWPVKVIIRPDENGLAVWSRSGVGIGVLLVP
uniref:Uncharacterized protein n=1 Tax=Arundo donax TaxID=35708 RepID=A0A0A9LR84_ARUDO